MQVIRSSSAAPWPRVRDAIASRAHSATSFLCQTHCNTAQVLSRSHSSSATGNASGAQILFRPATLLHSYGTADSDAAHRATSRHEQDLYSGCRRAGSANTSPSRHCAPLCSPFHGKHSVRSLTSSSADTAEGHLLRLRSLTEEQVEELLQDEAMRKALAIVNKKVLAARMDNLHAVVYEPTRRQYILYYRDAFIPFVFFGFLDNSIMLLFGDFFDLHLGVTFGISTLAAAALGNVVGDCTGIWLTGTIEAITGHLRLQDHGLTFEQRRLTKSQTIKTVGMTSGIFVGCILGMFPLIWPEEWRLWSARDELQRQASVYEAETAFSHTDR